MFLQWRNWDGVRNFPRGSESTVVPVPPLAPHLASQLQPESAFIKGLNVLGPKGRAGLCVCRLGKANQLPINLTLKYF